MRDLRVLEGGKKKKWQKVKGESLAIYLPTGIYYVRKSFRRDRLPNLSASTGEKTIGRARAKADALIAAHKAYYLRGEQTPGLRIGKGKKVSDVIEEILRTQAPQKRPSTQDYYRIYFAELQKEWGHFDVDRVTVPLWLDWLEEFRKRKSRRTFGDYQKFMNLLLRYAFKMRYTRYLTVLPKPDKVVKTGRVFTVPELLVLFHCLNEDSKDQFVLSAECGMRLREVLHLTWDRINLETGLLTLRAEDVKTGSKTGKGREFHVSPQALERLRLRRDRFPEGRYVFGSPKSTLKPLHQNKTAWRNAKRRAGITGKARWHDLRHTFISRCLIDLKMNPTSVSQYCGVSIRTIERVYLHSTAEQTREVSQAIRIF